jgi:immunity protein Imm1 of predicted polymorphic toxin system
MSTWRLQSGKTSTAVPNVTQLRVALRRSKKGQFKEVWLKSDSGASMCMLRNGDRAWLMFLRDSDGDPGLSSRNPGLAKDKSSTRFLLSNGQMDEYPTSWTLPIDVACRAMEAFFSTGSYPDDVTWHDDAG